MAKKKDDIVSVLAFEKKLVPSDAYMYGTSWEKRNTKAEALQVWPKSVRGTISNRFNKKDRAELDKDPMKLDAKLENANLQTVDHCALGIDQDTLKMIFTLKVLSNVQKPSACNNKIFNETYTEAAEKYIKENGFTELAKRYATNIANARFLWRNRIGAEEIEVVVKILNEGQQKEWSFKALDISIRNFDHNDGKILELADAIASALSKKIPFLLLEITTYAKTGIAQEVYPSEELVLDKGKGDKSKILYQVNGIAAMHSQKIGNALRSIDTWYPKFNEVTTGPIAIEPYGAVTNLSEAYRNPKDNSDFYTLFDRFARGEKLANKEEEHYVMAILVRGGVFGESSKE